MSKGDGRMNVSMQHGEERATTADVMHKQRTGDLPVPFAEITVGESIVTGFRQAMFDLRADDGYGGDVCTSAGMGGDFITLTWNDRRAVIRGIDLLRAWVATHSPEDAAKFPEGLR